MDKRTNRDHIQNALNTTLSGLHDDPWLAQRVIAEAKGEKKVKKKISVGVVVFVLLLITSITAVGAVLLNEHSVEMFEDVSVKDLLPKQWQQYDVCHKMSSGYLVGGFELGEDYIAPMSDASKILYLDETFTPVWMLEDERLDGCLFDRVEEAAGSFFFGMEKRADEWVSAIMKVSQSGTLDWLCESDPDFRMTDYIVTDDGVTYCTGNRTDERGSQLLILNEEGGLQNNISVGSDDWITLEAISEWDANFILAGKGESCISLLLVNKAGEILSQKDVKTAFQAESMRLQSMKDGRLVLVVATDPNQARDHVTQETKYMVIPEDIFLFRASAADPGPADFRSEIDEENSISGEDQAECAALNPNEEAQDAAQHSVGEEEAVEIAWDVIKTEYGLNDERRDQYEVWISLVENTGRQVWNVSFHRNEKDTYGVRIEQKTGKILDICDAEDGVG